MEHDLASETRTELDPLGTEPIPVSSGVRRWPLVVLALIAAVLGVFMTQPDPTEPVPEDPTLAARREATAVAASIPSELLAASRFRAEPSAETAAALLRSLGGFDGVTDAHATGAFDRVSFDPFRTDRLLATMRSSYGEARNEDQNERWAVRGSRIDQELSSPAVGHDFVHFNVDGTTTRWRHAGGDGFAPRVAEVVDRQGTVIATTPPIHASRFSVVDGVVFALTGDRDYYSNEPVYVDLVAVVDGATIRLADGAPFGWIDHPVPEVMVAYPASSDGETVVFDVATLLPLLEHPLAGRPYRRIAVSGDRTVAVAARFDDQVDVIDLVSGRIVDRFGDVDVDGVEQPLTLDADGSVLVSVERDGLVTVWWMAERAAIGRLQGDAAQPRWVSERYAAQSTSVTSADATRIAVRIRSAPSVPIQWGIVSVDPDDWVGRACRSAGRAALTVSEREALGLTGLPTACF